MSIKQVNIGSSTRHPNNILTAQCIGEDENDEISNTALFGQLGVTSRPYPATDSGMAECLLDTISEVIISARDTRIASVVGNIEPGDTCVHSTGPEQNARIFCKENNKVIALLVKDKNGKDMGITIDGDNQKITMIISGTTVFEISTEAIIAAIKTPTSTSNSVLQIKPNNTTLSSGQVLVGPGPEYSPVLPAVATLAAPSVMLSTT